LNIHGKPEKMKHEIKRSNDRERAVAFVVVRLSSSRFPAKQLRLIGNRPLLRWITDRLRCCKELDEIVITTVAETANEPLREFAQEEGLPCFWYEGEVDHVTTRLRRAAEAFNADICLLISGDCPLVYAPAIDDLIRQLRSDPEADIVSINPDKLGQTPALEGVSVARKKAWQLADDLSDRPELKEHQFPVIGIRPELFKTKECPAAKDLYAPSHRLSVDTWADMEFMNKLYEELTNNDLPFELPDVLKLLREKPELREINSHVHQRGLVEDIKRVLFVADAGQNFGYGHLMRSMELALQIVERLGCPVSFLVDDELATTLLEERGFRVIRGAFERCARPAPGDQCEPSTKELISAHDLVLFDIYCRRGLPLGWRKRFKTDKPVVVLDRAEQWAKEADLIVLPGITGPLNESDIIDTGNARRHTAGKDRPEIMMGLDYVILRREIQRVRNLTQNKDIDILAYLHPAEQREAVSRFADHYNIRACVVNGFDPDFPQLLARARFFLGSFGYSFYEALALDAYPVVWPLSDFHRKDTLVFYHRMDLAPVIIDQEDELEKVLYPLLASDKSTCIALKDGTPAIVQEIAELLRKPLERST